MRVEVAEGVAALSWRCMSMPSERAGFRLVMATLAETEVAGHSLTTLVSGDAMNSDIGNGECTEHIVSTVVIGPVRRRLERAGLRSVRHVGVCCCVSAGICVETIGSGLMKLDEACNALVQVVQRTWICASLPYSPVEQINGTDATNKHYGLNKGNVKGNVRPSKESGASIRFLNVPSLEPIY
jgi:hypothetical protein